MPSIKKPLLKKYPKCLPKIINVLPYFLIQENNERTTHMCSLASENQTRVDIHKTGPIVKSQQVLTTIVELFIILFSNALIK